KRKSLLAAETLQRTDLFFRDELFDFLRLKHATAQRFPNGEVALLALALFILLVNFAATFRAGDFQRAEIARNRIVLERLRPLDNPARHLFDALHELRATQLPALHLAQFIFPFAG